MVATPLTLHGASLQPTPSPSPCPCISPPRCQRAHTSPLPPPSGKAGGAFSVEVKSRSKMDQVSFSASLFSGITTPKLGMLAPGEGRSVWALGLLLTMKAMGSETGGSYSLAEIVVYPDQEVSRHVHTLEDEMWYMLEGELIWNLGGRESLGRKGSFIRLPRFIPHSFMNKSGKLARMVLMYAPGGFEQWYLDVGRAAHDPSQLPPDELTADELTQASQRSQKYGVTFVAHDREEENGLHSLEASYK